MPDVVNLRIHVLDPPAGFAYCLQHGKGGAAKRLPHELSDDGDLTFEIDARVAPGRVAGTTNFTGPFTQGTPSERFFYLKVGRVGDVEPEWIGRIKVPLWSIPWRQAEAVCADPDLVLEASFEGTIAKGRPRLATVPLMDAGWTTCPR